MSLTDIFPPRALPLLPSVTQNIHGKKIKLIGHCPTGFDFLKTGGETSKWAKK